MLTRTLSLVPGCHKTNVYRRYLLVCQASCMRVGIYARVSTHDQQTLPMQLKLMKEYIKHRGWKLAVEFREIGSVAKVRPNARAFENGRAARDRRDSSLEA